jgi:rRNA maturation RNase YbeY
MINFNYENDFSLSNEEEIATWLSAVILSEIKKVRLIIFFCDDEYLHKINVEYLDHDTLTDVISFDYSVGNEINGDFISTERVVDNAKFNVSFNEELLRVIVHGILHYCGYKDKSDNDEVLMRSKEDEKDSCSNVKQ